MIEMKVNLIDSESKYNSCNIISQKAKQSKQDIVDKLGIDKFPELTNQNTISRKCVMNMLLIFNESEYSVYSCLACSMDNICQFCFETCHYNHNISKVKGSNQLKTVAIKNNSCNCAMNDHKSKREEKQAEFKKQKSSHNISAEINLCPLNEVISLSNPIYYYYDASTKKNICTFCALNCIENEDDLPRKNLIKIKSGESMIKITPCGCNKLDSHSSLEENICDIYNIMKDFNINKDLNGIKLAYQLLTNKAFLNKYLRGYIANSEIIRSSLDKNGPNLKEIWEVTRGNFNYDISIQLLESLAEKYSSKLILPVIFKKNGNLDININNNNNNFSRLSPNDTVSIISDAENLGFEKYFNIGFLTKLFSLQEVNGDHLFSFKLNCLQFYRKFVFMPMIKNKNFFFFDSYENVTAIHRILLGRNIPEALKNSDELSQLENLLDTVLNSFHKYSEKEIEAYQFIHLGIEILKFYKILIPFHNLNYNYLSKTLDKLEKVMDVLKTKKSYENLVIKHLEKIISNLIILNNDYILYSELFSDDKKLNEFSHKSSFSFQNSEFNKKMILNLFSYSKDASENSDYLLNKHIYDILVVPNDYYSETLECLIESDFKEIINDKNFEEILKEEKDSKDETIFKCYFITQPEEDTRNILINKNENLEKELKMYLSLPGVNEEIFMRNLITDLKDYKITVEGFLTENKNLSQNITSNINHSKYNQFRKRIGLFKIGCFDILFNFCKFFNEEIYFTQNIFSEKLKEIFNLIFQVFDLFASDNPFIAILFFNMTMINTLFKNESMLKENLKFFLHKIKILSKSNYKVNPELLIAKILKQVNFEDYKSIDIDSKETILRIFTNLLKITNEKSLMIINDKISSEIIKIIFSDEFVKEMDDYLMELKNTQTNEDLNENKNENNNSVSNFQRKLSKISNTNLEISTDYIIRLTYSCINLLIPEYFYLITESLQIQKISEILMNFNLEPEKRRIFARIYFRFFVESHFKIHLEMSKELLDSYCKEIDTNVLKVELIKEKISNSELDAENATESNLTGIEPILRNLEKFRRIFTDNKEYFSNLKLSLRYFEDVIFVPSVHLIYKICYFEKEVSAKFKFNVYRLIFLFMQCFKFQIENLKKIDFGMQENNKQLNKYFYISEKFKIDFRNSLFVNNHNENSQSFKQIENNYLIQEYLDKLLTDLEYDISLMDSSNFHQLNLKLTLEIYFKFARNFHSYQQSMGSENLSCESIEVRNNKESDFTKKLSGIVLDYKKKKENYIEDNVLAEIFSINPDIDPYIQKVKDTIALDLLKKLELPKANDTLSLYNEQNTAVLDSIIKLFKTDPTTWQNIIVDSVSTSKYFFYSVISKQLTFLLQFIIIEFNRLDTNLSTHYKKNFLTLLEFIRLLCEDHNKNFQTLLINSKIIDSNEEDGQPLYFINFLLKIPVMIITNVQYNVNKKEIGIYFKNDATFFIDILEKITELLIEIMQGAFSFNFDRICKCKEFEDYIEIHYKMLDFVEFEEIYEIIISNFLKFLNCFIEENSNITENKINLLKKLNPGKLFDVMMNSFKKLYIKEFSSGESLESLKSSQTLNKIFKKNFHEDLIQAYINKSEELSQNPLFIITIGVFVYFKRISYYKIGGINEKIKRILVNLSEADDEWIKTENQNKQAWHEVVRSELNIFLNKLVKEVEISYRQDDNMEEAEFKRYSPFFEHDQDTLVILTNICDTKSEERVGIEKVIFLVHANSLFIKQKDYHDFIASAPLDSFNTKLNYSVEFYPHLMNILQMRKMLNDYDTILLPTLYELDYKKLEIISAIFSIATNAMMFLSVQYKMNEIQLDVKINDKITVYEITDPYELHTLKISLSHLILLSIIIINWFSFTILKHLKYSTKKTNIIFRILSYLSFIINKEIFPFIWNFFFGVIPIINTNFKFLLPLQLFTIFNISPTMSSVLFAVRIRYKQFVSTGFLLAILILFYSSIIFYFYRGELYNDEIKENICESFLQCFMYMLNYGIRKGDGVTFKTKTISSSGYWSEFLFNWVFYFSIVLIMVNIINGIIVDTFQALREQNNERDDAIVNVCYVCSLNRQKFETKGLSFEDHVHKEHYVLNYFEYFTKIKMTDEHDLNSLDFQVLKSFNEGRTDFYPVKKAKCLEKNGD